MCRICEYEQQKQRNEQTTATNLLQTYGIPHVLGSVIILYDPRPTICWMDPYYVARMVEKESTWDQHGEWTDEKKHELETSLTTTKFLVTSDHRNAKERVYFTNDMTYHLLEWNVPVFEEVELTDTFFQNWHLPWSCNVVYQKGDVVVHRNKHYKTLAQTLNVLPSESLGIWWEEVSTPSLFYVLRDKQTSYTSSFTTHLTGSWLSYDYRGYLWTELKTRPESYWIDRGDVRTIRNGIGLVGAIIPTEYYPTRESSDLEPICVYLEKVGRIHQNYHQNLLKQVTYPCPCKLNNCRVAFLETFCSHSTMVNYRVYWDWKLGLSQNFWISQASSIDSLSLSNHVLITVAADLK